MFKIPVLASVLILVYKVGAYCPSEAMMWKTVKVKVLKDVMKGVYHVARKIQLICRNEFTNIILRLESFHMAKVALGKYLRGSGADSILTECGNLDVNVVESVLNGRNYVRSLKGLQLLKEALSRLQWDEFSPKDSKMDKYRDQLETII